MAFGKKVLDIREKESEYTRKDRTAGMLMHFSWTLAPFAVSIRTFTSSSKNNLFQLVNVVLHIFSRKTFLSIHIDLLFFKTVVRMPDYNIYL